jgi:simple sugar transport system permease protein
MSKQRLWKSWLCSGRKIVKKREFGVTLAIIGLFVIGVIVQAEVFLTLRNLIGILRNVAVVGIIGFGMTLLITSGEFDLAVGSTFGISAAIAATMLLTGYNEVFTLMVVVLFATLFGIVQGILVTKLDLPSLIVTIGTLTFVRGAHLVILGNVTRTISPDNMPLLLQAIGGTIELPRPVSYTVPFVHTDQQTLSSLPVQIFWVFILGFVFHYVLTNTKFGLRTQFTGQERPAKFAGVSTDYVKIYNFAIVSLTAAFAGISQFAYSGSVSPLTGDGQALIVIAAVVIGGTDLFGGKGTMVGTLLGAIVFGLIQNILVLAGFGSQLFAIFTGVFILLAVAFEAVTRRISYRQVRSTFLSPLVSLLTDPNEFFLNVREADKEIDRALGFITATMICWIGLVLPVVLGTNFSLWFINSDLTVIGSLPLLAFSLTSLLSFLSTVFVHTFVKICGGSGTIDESIKVVAYGFAPGFLFAVPFVLAGLDFIVPIIGIALSIPIALIGYLWFVGLQHLQYLSARKSGAVLIGTLALWTLTALYIGIQI